MSWQGHSVLYKHQGNSQHDWFRYTCGHCGHETAGAVVATFPQYDAPAVRWILCMQCLRGSVIHENGQQCPGQTPGPAVQGLPSEIEAAYGEARSCMSVNAFTACELLCRKLLMHVAAEKGAPEGESFVAYLTYLEQHGYVTPPMKPWVDLIRSHGNRAAHELEPPDATRAESTLLFTAELLRLVYEMEHYSRKYAPSKEGRSA